MPSAASQLISLDLFSSGQRNGFDLASSCYGSFSLLVSYDLLDLSLLLCWSSCGVSIQKPGVFFSLISHYLRNLRFVPSSLRTKANADGSLSSGQRQQQGCREKEWRLSERVGTSRYPVHFFASFFFLSLLLVHISCHVRCNAGYIRWWALVERR